MYEDKEFSPEILKSDLEHMEVISESVVNVSRSFLIDEDKLRIKTKHLWQLKTVFDNLFNKFSEEDRYKEFAPDYCIKMADFVTKITGSYSENAIDNSEAHKRTEILMKSLEALVKASKGGIYLDYMNITIGGESFVQYMAPVVQRYRDNKLNWAIKMCNKIVKLAKVIIQVQTG